MNFRKTLARVLRIPATLNALREGGENWALDGDEAIADHQLRQLNEVWADALANVPFYKWWQERHHLPERIASLEDYAKWPVLTKGDLQAHPDLLVRRSSRKFHASVTGGATGEPLRFGTYPEQGRRVSASMLMARANLGFFPGDRVFLFWGHRHFYGHGLKAKAKFFVRRCKDFLNNTYRADACDLSPRYLRFVLDKLSRQQPEVVISYSASLLVLVRFAKAEKRAVRLPNLKCVICTAGPLSAAERAEISDFLGAGVYMEYGAMDAGQMAYMARDGRYHVFRRLRMLHVRNDGVGDLTLVTTLAKDYLPLFRYQIGDCLKDCSFFSDGRVRTFAEVYGRGSDVITLPSGLRFQVYTFMVCAEELEKILAYQLVRRGDALEFRVQATSPLTEAEREIVREKAYSIVPELRTLGFEIEDAKPLVKAPSGKIRLLVEERQPHEGGDLPGEVASPPSDGVRQVRRAAAERTTVA